MASFNFTHPEKFDFNQQNNWEKWFKRFERFRSASGLMEKSEEIQINTLIYCMGQEAEEILASFGLSEEEGKKWSVVVEKMNTYFIPKQNVIFERAKFKQRTQNLNESVDSFITDLYHLAEKCDFRGLHDELIRDRIVVGIRDHRLSERLHFDPALTLEKAVTEAKQREAVRSQQTEVRWTSNTEAVDAVGKRGHKPAKARQQHVEKRSARQTSLPKECQRCGGKPGHTRARCPAREAKCHKCEKIGHFMQKRRTHVGEVEEGDSSEEEAAFLGTVQASSSEPWKTTIKIKDVDITFKIDIGADVTLISEEQFKSIKDIKLQKTSKTLYGAGHSKLNVIGKFQSVVESKCNMCVTDIYVVKNLEYALLGRPAIEALKIIKVNDFDYVSSVTSLEQVGEKFLKLFDGLGKTDWEYNIKLSDCARPYSMSTPRRIPIPLMDKVKAELERMEKIGVISKVSEPTEWCSPMVVAPKPNGKIRICVDLTKLNESVKRERYQLPSVDESLTKLAGGLFFSKVDCRSGFWQTPLAEESQRLTTFITPFARFCFKVCPFGLNAAPEYYQRKMSELVEGLLGVICKMDDVLIFGKTKQEHNDRLFRVLERIENAGLTLNKEKCEFCKPSLTFLGHWIGQGTIQTDTLKVKAIVEMPKPESISDVRRFLGMCNQLAKFSPKIADLSKPLRSLLKGKNSWFWGPEQETAFHKLKTELSSPQTLTQYETNRETLVSADCSSYGMGGVLRQKHGDMWKPVAYASRSLSETEQRYAQIEKECLALTWVCQKFQGYLIGSKFVLETDHKPLVPLLSTKDLTDLPPRIQRFRLRLMHYDYNIVYTMGSKLITADCLSRAPLTIPTDTVSEELQSETDAYIQMVINSLPASGNRLEQSKSHYEKDTVCSQLLKYCKQGWPEKSALPNFMKQYWSFRGDITVQRGILFKGIRLVIPHMLQGEMMNRLHGEAHQGISKCRERAKQSVWWVGLSSALENTVRSCQKFIENTNDRPEPLMPLEFPERPWQRVASDLFEIKGQNYLLLVEYFSRYIEIAKLTNATSACVVNHMKSIFARHGIPDVVYSDNSPCYSGSTFKIFASDYGFEHHTSSPKMPQSIGLAERSVRTVKDMIKKADDPYLALLSYRTTPLHNGFSPSELLMGRILNTAIPVKSEQLKPKWPDFKNVQRRERKIKQKQKSAYDSRHKTKPLSNLENRARVFVKDQKKPGTVISKSRFPRSYRVKTDEGIIRRNRRHLALLPQNEINQQTGLGNEETKWDNNILPTECEYKDLSEQKEVCEDNNNKHCVMTRSGRVSKPPMRLIETC